MPKIFNEKNLIDFFDIILNRKRERKSKKKGIHKNVSLLRPAATLLCQKYGRKLETYTEITRRFSYKMLNSLHRLSKLLQHKIFFSILSGTLLILNYSGSSYGALILNKSLQL
jgi:hypothetical protein